MPASPSITIQLPRELRANGDDIGKEGKEVERGRVCEFQKSPPPTFPMIDASIGDF